MKIKTIWQTCESSKGAFKNYVDRFFAIFDHHLPLVDRCRHLDNHPPLVYVDISKMTTLLKNQLVPTFAQKKKEN